jgi:hypothetical protein
MYLSGMRNLNLNKSAAKSGDADTYIPPQSIFDGHVMLYCAHRIRFEIQLMRGCVRMSQPGDILWSLLGSV